MDFRKIIISLILFVISWNFGPLIVINWGTVEKDNSCSFQLNDIRKEFLCSVPQVDMPALFPGCKMLEKHQRIKCSDKKMKTFIARNLRYPKTTCVSGLVVLNFIIKKDGSISNIKILRELGAGSGAEAVRVVKLFPKWIPAMQNGKPIEVTYNLPIRFCME